MRRIYDSEALHRDDEEPGTPAERHDDTKPRMIRWFDTGIITRRVVPGWLRNRAVSVSLATPRDSYGLDERVPFQVTIKNALPMAITMPTESPLLWTWAVDGHTNASRVRLTEPPAERHGHQFGRGEHKRFRKSWDGMFRVSESEWEPAGPGEYTISAALNVEDAAEKGLADELTVTLRED